jgi:hypothetical protein
MTLFDMNDMNWHEWHGLTWITWIDSNDMNWHEWHESTLHEWHDFAWVTFAWMTWTDMTWHECAEINSIPLTLQRKPKAQYRGNFLFLVKDSVGELGLFNVLKQTLEPDSRPVVAARVWGDADGRQRSGPSCRTRLKNKSMAWTDFIYWTVWASRR